MEVFQADRLGHKNIVLKSCKAKILSSFLTRLP